MSRTPGTKGTKSRHFFYVDNHNVGTCSLCGEVRQFPIDKRQPVVVLKPGSPPACRLGSQPMGRTLTT